MALSRTLSPYCAGAGGAPPHHSQDGFQGQHRDGDTCHRDGRSDAGET
jgi:hypothetical protein